MTAIALHEPRADAPVEFRQRHLSLYPAPDQAYDPQGAMDDATLDREFSNGDHHVLRHAYDRYGSLVYTFCRKTVGPHLADDVSQEVFVAAWNSRGRFDPDRAPLGAWLIGIAKNKMVDALRREGRQPLPSEDRHDHGEHGASEGLADRLVVADALAHLPERARVMVELAFFGGLTHGEIAERTNTPLGTVKSDIRRALSRMRTLVEDTNDGR
jgi:RNA polymerase sigma factor (sigma-70 family)